jgi:hypothetical protein
VFCAVPRTTDRLPSGFHRICHYGLFANGRRAENLARVRDLLEPFLPCRGNPRLADAGFTGNQHHLTPSLA